MQANARFTSPAAAGTTFGGEGRWQSAQRDFQSDGDGAGRAGRLELRGGVYDGGGGQRHPQPSRVSRAE